MTCASHPFRQCGGLVLALLLAAPVQAGEVGGLTSFTAGTRAVAAEVNANFTAVKTAVDDNHARIDSHAAAIANLTTAKQNRVVGSCAAGWSIRQINADGSVLCQQDTNAGGDITGVTAGGGLAGGGTSGDVTLRLANGRVSVPAAALSPQRVVDTVVVAGLPTKVECHAVKQATNYYYYDTLSSNQNCDSIAPVHLPDGATLTGLTCRLYDSDTAGSSYVELLRMTSAPANLDQMIPATIYRTPATINTTGLYETVSDTTADVSPVVSNTFYNYVLVWKSSGHNTATVGTNARFHNCSVGYTF
jgi:hypothetical protein